MLLEAMKEVYAARKHEYRMFDWMEAVLDDYEEKGQVEEIENYEVVIQKVHPLGKRTLTDAMKRDGWKEEEIEKFRNEGKITFKLTEDCYTLTIYDIRKVETKRKEDYILLLESDIRYFHPEPDKVTYEELENFFYTLKDTGGLFNMLVAKFCLYFIKRKKKHD